MKKHAFTLAEMLIVIGIIGVVAALVIPSLIANYQERVLATQMKKAEAEISQAGLLAIAQDDAGDFKNTKAYLKRTFLSDYFKKSKDCGTWSGAYKDCLGAEYKKDGEVYNLATFVGTDRDHCIIAKAGYSLCLHENYGVLDINGPKGPNVFDKDAFKVLIGSDGSLVLSDDVSVVLSSVGSSKVAVVKEVKTITGLGLREAKDLVDSAPCVIKEGVELTEAEEIKNKLESVGATVDFN